MSDTNKTNKVKKTNRKSQKGTWGKIGAPPKAVHWPSTPFTIGLLETRNTLQCSLSLRNKVAELLVKGVTLVGKVATGPNGAPVADGMVVELESKKQPGGAVGRPKAVFVLAENFDSSKMVLKGTKTEDTTPVAPKTRKPRKVKTEAVAASPVPESAPVSAEPAPAPAPVETVVVAVSAPAEAAPLTPAPVAPVSAEPVAA
jgi:hypothetical protein